MKVGTCPTCQQSNIGLYRGWIEDEDPGRFEDGMVYEYLLDTHNHQGGQHCTGSGTVPQFVYDDECRTPASK